MMAPGWVSLLVYTLCMLAQAADYHQFQPQIPLLQHPARPLPRPGNNEFKLRHMFHHGGKRFPGLHRQLDIPQDADIWLQSDADGPLVPLGKLTARSRPVKMQRLADQRRDRVELLQAAGRAKGSPLTLPASDWNLDDVVSPNVTDQDTVLTLAKMALDAYAEVPGTGDWQDVGSGFNRTDDFGWELDGIRGHIFGNQDNSTIVISLKGTSVSLFDGIGSVHRDRDNDNLFFSCCCGQGDNFLYRPVCDCQTAAHTCNTTCVSQALNEKNNYYHISKDLYYNVTERYPDSQIWLVGHSLGGAVSALLGATFGLPTVTFEAPGEAMAARRLGLPTPPGYRTGALADNVLAGAYHFGNTGDPLYLGTCNSFPCSALFFAMQSQCHTGYECVYNSTRDLGWSSDLRNHMILNVVNKLIPAYDEPAACKVIENCQDCKKWTYFDSHSSPATTTTKASTTTRFTLTRTTTCQTPGWFGCLDETTTSGHKATSTAATTHTTCKTPGWFGCKDEVTTTTGSTTSPTTSTTLTTSCETPGWFGGCNDATTTTDTTSPAGTTSAPASTTCNQPGWFGGCNDPSSVTLRTSSSATSSATASCSRPGRFWGCNDRPSPGSSPQQATASATAAVFSR